MRVPTLPARAHGVAVKVCGLTRPSDAALAAELGAAALGVVFAPSPRQVDPARAAEVLGEAPAGVLRVGVFVDPEPGFVAEVVEACGLHWVQLSGRELPKLAREIMEEVKAVSVASVPRAVSPTTGSEVRGLKGGLPRLGIVGANPAAAPTGLLKAIHVRRPEDLRAAADYPAHAFLLDSPPLGGRMGGTGRSFDWTLAGVLPWDRERVVLAGGLTARNLAAAVAAVRPAMVDVSSGVESAPGIKDAGRLRDFLEAAARIELEEGAWRG
jgi:phosphoribosylanthranilate isomerase